jgi:hypothetical protein
MESAPHPLVGALEEVYRQVRASREHAQQLVEHARAAIEAAQTAQAWSGELCRRHEQQRKGMRTRAPR